MTKELTFRDRAGLIYQILPKFGQIETMKTVRTLKAKLAFSTEEQEIANLKEMNNRLTWGSGYIQILPKTIDITDSEIEVIQKGITQLDKMGQVQEELLDTIDKFISAD